MTKDLEIQVGNGDSTMRASLKKAKRKSMSEEPDVYMESKSEDFEPLVVVGGDRADDEDFEPLLAVEEDTVMVYFLFY